MNSALYKWLWRRYLGRKHIMDVITEHENRVNPYKRYDLIVYDDMLEEVRK